MWYIFFMSQPSGKFTFVQFFVLDSSDHYETLPRQSEHIFCTAGLAGEEFDRFAIPPYIDTTGSFKKFFPTWEGVDQKAIRELRVALASAKLAEEGPSEGRQIRSKTKVFKESAKELKRQVHRLGEMARPSLTPSPFQPEFTTRSRKLLRDTFDVNRDQGWFTNNLDVFLIYFSYWNARYHKTGNVPGWVGVAG